MVLRAGLEVHTPRDEIPVLNFPCQWGLCLHAMVLRALCISSHLKCRTSDAVALPGIRTLYKDEQLL